MIVDREYLYRAACFREGVFIADNDPVVFFLAVGPFFEADALDDGFFLTSGPFDAAGLRFRDDGFVRAAVPTVMMAILLSSSAT